MGRTTVLIGLLCLVLTGSTLAAPDLSCDWIQERFKKIEDSKAEEVRHVWADAMRQVGANEVQIAATRDFAGRRVFLDPDGADRWWFALNRVRTDAELEIFARVGCRWRADK